MSVFGEGPSSLEQLLTLSPAWGRAARALGPGGRGGPRSHDPPHSGRFNLGGAPCISAGPGAGLGINNTSPAPGSPIPHPLSLRLGRHELLDGLKTKRMDSGELVGGGLIHRRAGVVCRGVGPAVCEWGGQSAISASRGVYLIRNVWVWEHFLGSLKNEINLFSVFNFLVF